MTKRRLAILLAAGITLLTLLVLALPRYLHLDTYKPTLIAELQKQLHREVHYDTSEVSLGWGAVFTFNRVTVSEKDFSTRFLAANRLRVTVAIIPLLHGQLVIRNLALDQPEATIIRLADGRFNISDLAEERPEQPTAMQLHKIALNNATLRFVDHLINRPLACQRCRHPALNIILRF